jgi:hypothetical protein
LLLAEWVVSKIYLKTLPALSDLAAYLHLQIKRSYLPFLIFHHFPPWTCSGRLSPNSSPHTPHTYDLFSP